MYITLARCEAKLIRTERSLKVRRRWAEGSALLRLNVERSRRKLSSATRRRLHQQAKERRHLKLLKRDARGSATAQRISIQLRGVNGKLGHLLRDYNVQRALPDAEAISLATAREPDDPFYEDLEGIENIAYSVRKEAVFAHEKLRRAEEEIRALRIEIVALMSHLRSCKTVLHEAIQNAESAGFKSFLIMQADANEDAQVTVANVARRQFRMELDLDQTILHRVLLGIHARELSSDSEDEPMDDFDEFDASDDDV